MDTATMLPPREGDWGCTYSGRQYWPLSPRPDDFHLLDIAHALSLQCRFGGHCAEFYSVAQHSVHVSEVCDPADAMWGLLHDAAEAYLVDVPRPAKAAMPEYHRMEKAMMAALCTRFNLPAEMPASVKSADEAMLATEARALMPLVSVEQWYLPVPPAEVVIQPWSPAEAKHRFVLRWAEIVNGAAAVRALLPTT